MNEIMLNEIFGLSESHLAPYKQGDFTLYLHADALDSFKKLKEAAKTQNIDIAIASSFRSFERQALIWNNKFTGKRPVYDKNNQVIDMSKLTDWQKVQAILKFSALPGATRHHWGTDIDIFDANAMPQEYHLQLSPDEYSENGIFRNLSLWLKNNLNEFDFYQPYIRTDMGIAQELWHISYGPTASVFTEFLSQNSNELLVLIQKHQIEGSEAITNHFDEILETYVFCAASPLEFK